ncbi:IPT/TIG domain-containing protein [Streptomyces sp. 8N616]|uniref:IPT/TIG domain-containing protein n=1 Tax=Streptomyces sp. 8N616 TaxID=3457414 RepID=UPI003FD1E1AD
MSAMQESESPLPPVADAIIPATGSVAGGTAFTITGSNLTNATVTVGGAVATGINVNAAGTVLTGITPAGVSGNAAVIVTTPAGTTTVNGGFTYTTPQLPPVTFSINPAIGPVVGGTAFIITGSNLANATVTVGGAPAIGINVNAAGTVLTGITPAGVSGNAAVVVTTPAGTATVNGGFTYV